MNFLSKKWIPAALLAGVTSVVVTAPAQAIGLTKGSSLSFAGAGVSVVESTFGDTSATFSISAPFGITTGTGSFAGFDTVFFSTPLSILNGNGSLANFIFDINSAAGNIAYSVNSITDYSEVLVNGVKTYNLGLLGTFSDSSNASGVGAMQVNISNTGSFSGTLDVVPTPAAVLPILGGLFGFASKRKREAEADA